MDALSDMTIERLAYEIGRLCAEFSLRLARWLELVAEFDRRGGALRWGATAVRRSGWHATAV